MFPKTQHVRGSTLKIYRVSITDTAGKASYTLWTSYQSAAQSHGFWDRKNPGTSATLDAAHVPDDAWKPVDPRVESKLNMVATLWEQLVAADEEGLDALLDELVKRVQPPKPVPVEKPVLSEVVRGEADALLKLDRLVSR